MGNTIRLAGIAYESLVNGPGMRRVFFSQGCRDALILILIALMAEKKKTWMN